MRGLKPIPTKMEEPLLQELLQIAHSEAPRELGSSDLPLLSQPLSQWKNLVNYIPAVPSECVRTAEKSYLDRPYSTHWEDELLLQASQAFSNQQEEEEDSLLLAASQDYEKRCGPLMTSDDVQSAVTAQVPLNTKRNNNWAANRVKNQLSATIYYRPPDPFNQWTNQLKQNIIRKHIHY